MVSDPNKETSLMLPTTLCKYNVHDFKVQGYGGKGLTEAQPWGPCPA